MDIFWHFKVCHNRRNSFCATFLTILRCCCRDIFFLCFGCHLLRELWLVDLWKNAEKTHIHLRLCPCVLIRFLSKIELHWWIWCGTSKTHFYGNSGYRVPVPYMKAILVIILKISLEYWQKARLPCARVWQFFKFLPTKTKIYT